MPPSPVKQVQVSKPYQSIDDTIKGVLRGPPQSQPPQGNVAVSAVQPPVRFIDNPGLDNGDIDNFLRYIQPYRVYLTNFREFSMFLKRIIEVKREIQIGKSHDTTFNHIKKILNGNGISAELSIIGNTEPDLFYILANYIDTINTTLRGNVRMQPLFNPQQDDPVIIEQSPTFGQFFAPPLKIIPPPSLADKPKSTFIDAILRGTLRNKGKILPLGNLPDYSSLPGKKFVTPEYPGLNQEDIDEFLKQIEPYIEFLINNKFYEIGDFIEKIEETKNKIQNGKEIDIIFKQIEKKLIDNTDEIRTELNNINKTEPKLSIILGNYINTIWKTLIGTVRNFWYPPEMGRQPKVADQGFTYILDDFMEYDTLNRHFAIANSAIKYISKEDKKNIKQRLSRLYESLNILFDRLREYLDEYKNSKKRDSSSPILEDIKQKSIIDIEQILRKNFSDIQKEMNTLKLNSKPNFNLINSNFGTILYDKRISGSGKKRLTRITKKSKSTKSNLAIRQLDTEIFKILNS